MAESGDVERDLQALAAEMRKLEGDYGLFFAGRLPKPPWEARARFEAHLKATDRTLGDHGTERFRFQQLEARYATLADLWERGLKAREEGRPGPFARPATPAAANPRTPAVALPGRVVHVASFSGADVDAEKLHDLYGALSDARRETGEPPVPFHKFSEFVREQVKALRTEGTSEVALRVAVTDGHVQLTARGLRGLKN